MKNQAMEKSDYMTGRKTVNLHDSKQSQIYVALALITQS